MTVALEGGEWNDVVIIGISDFRDGSQNVGSFIGLSPDMAGNPKMFY